MIDHSADCSPMRGTPSLVVDLKPSWIDWLAVKVNVLVLV